MISSQDMPARPVRASGNKPAKNARQSRKDKYMVSRFYRFYRGLTGFTLKGHSSFPAVRCIEVVMRVRRISRIIYQFMVSGNCYREASWFELSHLIVIAYVFDR